MATLTESAVSTNGTVTMMKSDSPGLAPPLAAPLAPAMAPPLAPPLAPPSPHTQTEPDADTIKMFVGQIPKAWKEDDLKKYFEQFGPVYHLNVLRDKMSGQSKGCCFVTFFTRKAALDAQNALHNVKTLPGMNHPVQMKPADSETRSAEDRKLFVGMLCKRNNEEEVRQLFAPFGQVDEVRVLRDNDGKSKGCAFVTFNTKQAALNAIKVLHQSQTMEGCGAPIVVKFADTQRDKDTKKGGPYNHAGIFGGVSPPVSPISNPHYLSILQHLSQMQGVHGVFNPNAASHQLLSLAAAQAAHGPHGPHSGFHGLSGLNGSPHPAAAPPPALATSLYTPLASPTTLGVQFPSILTSQQPSLTVQTTKQIEGPDGSNLFIYHLPQEFTDTDLAQTFTPFGTVVSAKVFIDKQTQMSKCFGFVSYDNPVSAQAAIQAMNGFQIGMKRLKVQLKRSKTENKPY